MNPQSIGSPGQVPVAEAGPRARAAAEPSRGTAAGRPGPAAGPPPVVAAAGAPLGKAQAVEAMNAANRWLAGSGSELTVEFDDSYGRAIFKLVDTQTGSLVRQVPSPEMLAISRALAEGGSPGALLRADA